MQDLQAERTTVIAALRLLGLPFEVHTQTVETRGAVRLFLSCDSLGGILAVNNGAGWAPCYPTEPSKGIRGHWYQPNDRDWAPYPAGWREAVIAALDPPAGWMTDGIPLHTMATRRAHCLRDPLRRAAALAILRGGEDVPTR